MEIYIFSNSELDDKQTSVDAIKKVRSIAKTYHLYEHKIKRGEYGKPYFANSNDIFFNISHTYGMTVIVFSNKEIGVDVEKVGFVNKKIIDKLFTESEKKEIYASEADKSDFNKKFFEIWTQKEAFVKKHGLSILSLLK